MKATAVGIGLLLLVGGHAATAGWIEGAEFSRLTDRLNVYAETRSADRPLGTLDRPAVPSMHLQCQENQTTVGLFFDIYIGHGDTSFAYRLDGGPPVEARAPVSEDGQFLGYSGARAISFLMSIASAKRILVRINPYAESHREAEFDLTGIDKQIRRVRSACNW